MIQCKEVPCTNVIKRHLHITTLRITYQIDIQA
jgi:hypothetical protein